MLDRITGRSANPVQIPEELAKLQYGFNGARIYHNDKPTGKGVILLEKSLTVADEGKWRAWGLVRNELPRDAGDIKVTAALFAADGRLLEKPSVTMPVDPLRPGEPGPFMLSSEVPVATVTRVEWSVMEGKPNTLATRDLETRFYWRFPYGTAQPRPSITRDDPPYPYVLATGFVNRDAPLADAFIVAAWLDRDRRVIWIETARMAPEFKRPLPPDGGGNFNKIQVYDPRVGPRLNEAEPWLWTVGLKAER